jgi:predicted anti-sigma-YlaC factor YlaD
MKVLSCAAARRRLQAYHDDELPVGQQIEVDAHLETCEACTGALEELDVLRSALRAATPGRVALTAEEHASFHAAVVSRAGAEQRMSLSTRLRSMFEDMHFVYAGLGAAGATVSCIAIMLSMMNFAALTNPGFNQNPVLIDARILMYAWPAAPTPNPMPGMLDQGFSGSAGADDGAFTLSAVVTREGRLVNLELHPEDGQQPKAGSSEARAVQTMLGAMSQARFEPARVGGLPIAVNMVWLVTHTTVRGTEAPKALPAAPVAKKRRVDLNVVPSARKAVIA